MPEQEKGVRRPLQVKKYNFWEIDGKTTTEKKAAEKSSS